MKGRKRERCVCIYISRETEWSWGAGGQSCAGWRRWEAHYCQANLKIINCEVDAF